MIVLGECWACGRMFSFNPERVPSIRASRGRPDPEGKREPVCRTCMERVNRQRARAGLPPHPIMLGAYEPEEVGL